jgi:hypothetical protein
MGMKQTLRNSILDHYFRQAATPRADNYYLALTVDGTEVVAEAPWTNYARLALNAETATTIFAAADNPTGTRSRSRNTSQLTFQAEPEVTGSGPEVDGWALYSASSGGTLLWDGDLASPQTINDGAPVTIPANGLVLFLDEADDS